MRISRAILFAIAMVLFVDSAPLAGVSSGPPAATDVETTIKAKDEKKPKKSRTYADKIRKRFRKSTRGPAKPKKKPKYKEWSEVVKDAKVNEGLFKVYTKREDVYFEIRKDQLDRPYLAVLSLARGIGSNFILGGLPVDDIMFDFRRVEDHVQMRRLNTLFRASGDSALVEALELTYGNSILFNLPIASENDSTGAVLVKMNDVFLSDLPDLAYFMRIFLKKPVRLDRDRKFFEQVKVFPGNIEVAVTLTYTPGDRKGLRLPSVPDSRYIEIGVHYSIIELPEEPMQPRLADDRVGYFLTPFKDFSRDGEESYMVHYVNRWRLEKKYPDSTLSEPKKPIVFYLDRTIPEKYKKFVAAGIEEWNKAFEEAGFRDAIVAREAPDDPDFDPEDARYNTIRWIVTDSPSFGAIGPSRVDPRTGEILDADILIDGNMVAGFAKVYRRYAGPDALSEVDPFLDFIEEGEEDGAHIMEELRRRGLYFCDMERGMAEQGAFFRLVLLGRGEIQAARGVPEEFIGAALKEVTMHEVGHSLGLRHNFKSSTATPYEKLNDKKTIERIGLTGSIMDYSPPNIARDRSQQGYYFAPTIGLYDRWAIKWGYIELDGKSPEEQKEALAEIAKEAWRPEHAYGPDEDTFPATALDPLSNIWDLGDDPLEYAQDRIAIVRDLFEKGRLEDRVVAEGDDYSSLRSAVETLFIQHYIAASMAVKYVGGQYTSRAHRGDPGGRKPFEPVPASVQRGAMRFLVENALRPEAFELSPDLLDKLVDPKLIDWQNNPFTPGRRFDFPLVGWVNAIQYTVLSRLLQPYLLQRMVDAEYKMEDPYTIAELFRTLTKAIWLDEPVAKGRSAAMKRNLQRNYIRMLSRMVVRPSLATPNEAVSLARLNLKRIKAGIKTALAIPGLGDAANAHLMESLARIDRVLDAKLEAGF